MNYFNYFTEIEEEFVKRRGSHMLVSPLDWSLMESWKQRGVPLHVVLRGINASFDSHEQRAMRGRRVNSLFYCQQEVESMFVTYCESRVGSNGGSHSTAVDQAKAEEKSPFTARAIIDYLTEQREVLDRLNSKYLSDPALSETFSRTVMRLEQIIEDLEAAKIVSTEALEIDLTMIEEVVMDGLKESSGPEKLKELRKEADQQLKSYRQGMEPEIYAQTLDNFIARRLREQHRIPRLSLFYL